MKPPADATSIHAFFLMLSLIVLTASIKPIIESSGRRRVIAIAIVALVPAATTYFWGSLSDPQLAASVHAVTSNFWVWLGTFVLVFAYYGYKEFAILRQRDRALRLVEERLRPIMLSMDRFVLPRELTSDQIRTIAERLKQHSPCVAKFLVQKHDAEASQFAEDIKMALRDGGWTELETRYEGINQEDWQMMFEMTPADLEKARQTRTENPGVILYEAFKAIGITADSGSGGGANTTQSVMTITVGRRRRDRHAILPARHR
jgi:hypothetical protein